MPRPDHNGMIDGYSSVQALRRLDGKASPRAKPPEESALDEGAAAPPKPAGFGHTALPTRHELICYSCGYAFVVTGRLDKVICPKCRTQLETGDKHIDGAWSGNLKTVGRVYINSGATVTSSSIVAMDIRVAGICRNTRLEPTRHLELDSGAQVEIDKLGKQRPATSPCAVARSISTANSRPMRARRNAPFCIRPVCSAAHCMRRA